MQMFFYFFFRTAWNQLRSFLRTWAFYLFLGLLGVGGILWYGLRWYLSRLAATNAELPTNAAEILTATGMSGLGLLELAVGIMILGLLVIQIIGAERSVSTMFKHADVNLLFASDLPPQKVLAFRVANTLELPILAGFFLAIRLPFLAGKYDLSLYATLSILLAWFLLLGFCVLLKIIIYELGSRHPWFRKSVRWVVIALLAVLCYAFYRTYMAAGGKDFFKTARLFFNAFATRRIPIWGWVKGTMLCALEGNPLDSVGMLSACVSLLSILSLIAWKLPADYYEETLRSAQETSLLQEAVNSEGAALLITRTRERTVSWDGFHHGWGSSIYFFRVFHNRLRTSRFFISRTMLTYCFAALAGGLYVRYFLEKPIDYIPVLVLAVMVFFRMIISPVTEDIRKDTFLLQPEPIWSKLFFSLLGGSCNCAVDIFFPLMIGSAAAGFSPLQGLAYLPVLVSLDFFASASGVFTDVSIPSSVGISFKQVIQIIMMYVGLIFDGVVLSYGINEGNSEIGFVLMSLLDLLCGGMFLGLTGIWLYPCKGKALRDETRTPDKKSVRRAYSRVGLALTCMFLAIRIAQLALSGAGFSQLVALYLPTYLIGLPVFLLTVGRPAERQRPDEHRLSLRGFLVLIPACFFVMYTGNLIGLLLQRLLNILVYLLSYIPGLEYEIPRIDALMVLGEAPDPIVKALILALAAPVTEEFVFRRCLIDRLRPYGEKAALIVSALVFGLFHSAANQVCYAFLLGLVFGYVYLRTGRLRYSMLLHILINSMSAIVLPLLLMKAGYWYDTELQSGDLFSVLSRPEVLVLVLYVAAVLILALFGAIVFAFGVRERELSPGGARVKTACSAWGIVLFLVLSVLMLL
ncbi:MAG: CPBP family intramembrane metalloprotease [Oscillospiraceae bacterium]|nr:CPBP family intramembrane metalloprotease [Oscillospiraceae bacterium]